MAIHPDIRDQAYRFFLEEAPELLQTIEAGILKLRQAREKATIHSIMRSAHSLKGGAASVGLDAIKAIAHRLETIFKSLYSDSLEIDSDLESQLLQAFDCLRVPLTEQLTQGYFDAEQALAVAEPTLAQLEERCQAAIAETENFIPGSADLGINMAVSIFAIDVGQGLERLAAVLANPAAYEVAGELRAQAEVFLGFAELLNLPGFARIAQTTMQALEVNPDRALEIMACALADFRAGQAAVLAGDLSVGGSPSDALVALSDRMKSAPGESAKLEVAPELLSMLETMAPEAAVLLLDQLVLPVPGFELASVDAIEVQLPETQTPDFEQLDQLSVGLEDIFGQLEQMPLDSTDNGLSVAESVPDLVDLTTEFPTTQDLLAQALLATEQIVQPLDDRTETLESLLIDSAVNSSVNNSVDNAAEEGFDSNGRSKLPINVVTKSIAPPAASRAQSPVTAGLTVRVGVDRLSRLNNFLGELTINRNGLALQNTQLRSAVRELLNRFERFQKTADQLRSASDQLLIAPGQQGTATPLKNSQDRSAQTTPAIVSQANFDALEMDSYTPLYSHTQTLLEEMVQLEEAVEDISLFNRQSEQMLEQHRKMLSQMQDELMWARMLPLNQMLNRFPRILRDLSNTYQKPVHLTLQGTDRLIDKAVLEKLYDPLLHLLRNAFDHGIESPEVRQAQGKPEVGEIAIQAYYKGRQVVIELRDDGQGLNLERIRDRVVELGWLTAEEAASMQDSQLCEFIFEPGFSTAAQVSDLSGRGIGLDVVREQLRSLKGSVAVSSAPGQGATFTLTLPLTLTITNLLVCFVGSTPIALRSDSITEILIPQPEQITQVGTQRLLTWQEQTVPTYRLSNLLTYACLIPEMPPSRVLAAVPSPADWEAPVLILNRGQDTFALQVDRLVTEQELVIKPFGTAIAPPDYVYGCTVLGDGSLIPVIDGLALIDSLLTQGLATASPLSQMDALTALVEANLASGPEQASLRISQATTVLVVDDAVTSRRMLAASLERAGYRVLQARDGQEALEQLQQSQAVQLVVCDIEMPNMNGFEFLTQRRQTPDIASIPTVMLTSRSNDKHRWLAMQLGATAYFTKPYLEQEFLGAIAKYIKMQA
jgi:chemotaxis family two-component system sensor histidine kinase/response regulator PixL